MRHNANIASVGLRRRITLAGLQAEEVRGPCRGRLLGHDSERAVTMFERPGRAESDAVVAGAAWRAAPSITHAREAAPRTGRARQRLPAARRRRSAQAR